MAVLDSNGGKLSTIEIWPDGVAPSHLLEVLSGAFRYPVEGLLETLTGMEELADEGADGWLLPDYWRNRVIEVLRAADCFSDRTEEQLAYTRLFIGSMKMEAPPFASYYLEKDHLLNGQAAVEVTGIYHLFGIEVSPDEIAPADHLRYLLAFLALMAQRYEDTGEEAFAEAYANFRDDYVLSWIHQCKELVDSHAEHEYYPKLIELIVDVLQVQRYA